MKKSLSLFLSVIMLLTAVFVPVSLVSAETPDWDTVLEDKYVFDFTNAGYFTDQFSEAKLDATLPWKENVTFDAGQGRGNRTVYPVYTLVSGNNWGPQSWYLPGTATIDGKDVNTLELNAVHKSNDYFVPLKSDGTPLELAPGHKYSINVTYYIESVEGSAMMEFCAGLNSSGAIAYNYTTLQNPLKFAGNRFAWLSGKAGTVESASLTLDLTNLADDANYDINTNTYSLTYSDKVYTLYNYFYFAITNGVGVVDIASLEIVRDDWTPDWENELENKYTFDFSDCGYYADVPNKAGQTILDSTKTWTYAPVSINPGLGRADRNIYPTYGITSTAGWGPQVFSWPESIVYDGVATDTAAVKTYNPGSFIPLKKDGKPLELVPGHSYTVMGTVVKTSFEGGSNGTLSASAGYPSGGYTTATSIASKDLCLITVNAGSQGEVINFYGTFTVPAATEYGYNASSNTFTNDSTEYYNYFFFEIKGYAKAQLNFVSLDVIRDDYVATGTVEYIDADGTTLKTVTANAGEYTIDYTLNNTADKVFAGWYLDSEYNVSAGATVNLTESGIKLYAKWRDAVNWSEELSQYYKFDISSMGNYADVPNKAGQTILDSAKTWTYAPISINPGFDRADRNIYPTYGTTSTVGWGPQNFAYKSTTTKNGESVDAVTFTNHNPGFFMPLKADGKPFEFAPGHTYTVNYTYEVVNIAGGSPILQVSSGIDSNGLINIVQHSGTYYNDISINCLNSAWIASDAGLGLLEKTCTITVPGIDDERYNSEDNTYTLNYDGVDYTLYNYLYFNMGNYGKATINFTSIEVLRDDYQAKGIVQYIDGDGSVIKSEEVDAGSYAVDFVPENTNDKYFAGWYLDSAYTQKVASNQTLTVTSSGLNIYAKWEAYKDSITTTPGSYYGVVNVPNMSATGVYYNEISSRSQHSQTTHAESNGRLDLSTTFWGDGILITAADASTCDLFRAAPNTDYRITLKFRITAETSREDGIDVAVSAGAGLPNNADYPKGKYYDENSLKSHIGYTNYKDGVTGEGEYITYTALYHTGELNTIPAIGVEFWVYQNAAVEIYELKVEKLTDTADLSGRQFEVLSNAKNNTAYRVNFSYRFANESASDIGIGFKTTAADGIGYTAYVEGENVAIYTVAAENTNGAWHNATVLLTTDMYAKVTDGEGGDDTLDVLNSKLFAYIIGDVALEDIYVCDITATELTNTLGNSLIGVVGGQCLTAAAEANTNSQAIRYSFIYDSDTGNEIYISGVPYNVKERGFIYANGNNYTTNGFYAGNMTVAGANNGRFIVLGKTTNLSSCWSISDIEGVDYYSVAFSTYVTGFLTNDTKELMVKAYVVVEADGQEFILYSDSINRSVEYIKAANNATIDPQERKLVWGYDFSKLESVSEIKAFHQNHNQNSFNTVEGDTRNAVIGGDNWVIEDGAMVLKITKSQEEGKMYDMPMTLSTRDKMSFKYGYLELEAEVPFEYGIHCGYWTVPQNARIDSGTYKKVNSEFDIFEVNGIYNSSNPESTAKTDASAVSNLHKWYHYYDENGNQMTGTTNLRIATYDKTGVKFTDGLFGTHGISDSAFVFSSVEEGRKVHKYGMEWNEEYIAFYIDGVEYFRTYISSGNDFYNPTEGHENSKGMDSLHQAQNILLTFCPRWDGYAWAFGGDLNNADYYDELYENGILDVSSQGGDSIDFKIHSIKLYQREGEELVTNY